MTPEAAVKKTIGEWLAAAGCVVSTPIGSSYGKSNMCDFIVAVPCPNGGVARYLEIEAKATKDSHITPRQVDKLAAVSAVGGFAWRVDADNIERFKQDLADLVGVSRRELADRVHAHRAQAAASAGARVHWRLVAKQKAKREL